jgi:hypothetical protein
VVEVKDDIQKEKNDGVGVNFVSPINNIISEDLDFILSHFEEPIWPRTISTHATEGRQILVYNREEALVQYKQGNLLDCRINAYPDYTEYKGINRQSPKFLFLEVWIRL